MTEQPASSMPDRALKGIGRALEGALFNSRWLMAPFYFGLVVSLAVLFLKFARMLWEFILHAPGAKSTDTILDVLSLIDLTLVGNLILIVVFSGYENFVSRIDTTGQPNWPVWITKIDFAGLKQKAARLDCRDLGDPRAGGIFEHRCRVRRHQDDLAGRRASGVRDLGAAPGAVGSHGGREK
jgi:uncharacterized membrane protein YqhA